MMRWVPVSLCALLWLACLALPPPAAAQAQDEVVPAGVWRLHVDTSMHTDSASFVATHRHQSLLDYLVPDATVRDSLQGDVRRSTHRVALTATYGLSDTWNLVVSMPWARVAQTSTVTSTSSNAAVQTQLQRLRTRTISGVGNLRVTSLHRPVFSDRHGLVLGYGLDWPIRRPDSPWAGRGTLLVDSPFPRAFGLLHYTFYPFIPRTHLDVRAEIGLAFTETQALVGGGHATVNPGNDGRTSIGWMQEFGRISTGISARALRQGGSLINHRRQPDQVSWFGVRLEVGYGNLTELEQAPIAFPYQVMLQYEQGVAGYKAPVGQELRVNLRFYF